MKKKNTEMEVRREAAYAERMNEIYAMLEEEQTEDYKYQKFDGCYGVVTERTRRGVYLTLDNGEKAFAFKAANLNIGAKVLCTVKELEREGRLKLVTVDSVDYSYDYIR